MKISKIKNSRDAWKAKAKDRGSKIRNQQKTKKARSKRAAKKLNLEEEIRLLKDENERLKASNISRLPAEIESTIQQKTLCVFIVISCAISFRSVPRILQVFLPLLQTKIPVPHFTSVINWTVRAGIAVFKQVPKIATPWVAIIDCSIDIGIRKALVVLRVSIEALQNRGEAVGLKDCQCIGLEISTKWNGQSVSDALAKVFEKSGFPAAIIKDGGTDLNKGVELFCAKNPEKKICIIDDVGHFAANALKALFAKSKSFVQFIEIISKGASRIRQTTLAWMIPPKIRTKGRFQGISEVAEWAQKLLKLMGRKGRAKDGSDLSKARTAFAGLAKLRPFLARFCFACNITDKFLKLMKTEGLNQATYVKAKRILVKLPKRSLVRSRLSAWLDKHISIQRTLNIGQTPLIVSSDALESLFGKFKTIIQRCPEAELNRLTYVIPLLCGNYEANDIDVALMNCSHRQMQQTLENTIPPTMRQQRVWGLEKCSRMVPKSGYFKRRESG